MTETNEDSNVLELATELTIAWLSNPNTRASAEEVPSFLLKMHQAVRDLTSPFQQEQEEPAQEYTPAVSARKSLASKDHIVSMIDGKSYKTLRRHLAGHGLTPEQYRERYNLKSDYPMVSESYSEQRRQMAKQIGLGRKAKNTTTELEPTSAQADEASADAMPAASETKPATRRKSNRAEPSAAPSASEAKPAVRTRRKKAEPASTE